MGKVKSIVASVSSSENITTSKNSPQIPEKPSRRRFSSQYKLKILAKLEEAKGEYGAVGKLLRVEGLYSSQVAKWKAEAEAGQHEMLGKKRGPKASSDSSSKAETERLKKQVASLEERLRQAEAIIDIQKKVSMILGVKLPTRD